ncbi:MAG TPA: SH3 domain-containing protein [Firmicutes bacterium]|jgi:N-acetylmuramoyl-L-alanine amidase|nr:SH3 domain-containing protein [Bacillota bacterium]
MKSNNYNIRYGILFNLLFRLSLILTMIITIAANASATEASNSGPVIQVKVNLLNMRTGPSTSFTKIEGLSSGTPFNVLSKTGDWLLIRLNDGKTGWVNSKYTSFSAEMEDKLPKIIGEKAIVEVNLLNVRVGPGLDFEKINQLTRNSSVTVYFEQDKWLLVRLPDGSSGWIYKEYTSYISNISNKKQQDKPQSKYPAEEKEEKEEKAEEAQVKEESPAEKENQGKNNQENMQKQYPFQVVVKTGSLRLREKPGLTNKPIGSIPVDTILTVMQSEDGWFQVILPDKKQGWVAGWYTEEINSEERNSESPVTYFRVATVKADVLKVRSGPGLEHTQTGRVYSGNHLLTIQEKDGWYYVQTPTGQYGWISGEYASIKEVTSETSRSTTSRDGSARTQDITLVIDPGHGGSDAGATGITGLKEKDVNLTVSLYLAELLRSRGFNVVLTRNNDIGLSLSERVAIAERAEADLFISIHANAHLTNIFASGTETYYYQNKSTSPQSFYLASLIQRETTRLLKLPNRGVKTKPFHVIKETSMPSALLELAFLSNAVDEKMLKSSDFLKLGAEGIYRAILRYYNL